MPCNDCPTGNAAVVVGCMNGLSPVNIHYDYVRDVNTGEILGVNTKYTLGDGTLIVPGPGDVINAGPCPIPPAATQDWEYSWYADGVLPCRKIIIVVDQTLPPNMTGYEINGPAIPGFDATKIVPVCPCICTQRTPGVAW